MKIKQFTYPFNDINLFAGTVRHIGFEFPQFLPLSDIDISQMEDKLFSFYETYRVEENDVLEFDKLNRELLNSQLNSPEYKYAIIDILYE